MEGEALIVSSLAPQETEAVGCTTPKPRLMGVGEKELTQKAEEALGLRVLNPGYTLKSLGEHFQLNTSTLAPTLKRF